MDEDIKQKLCEAVELWADRYLTGKPALLANMIYFSLEESFLKKIQEINENF